MLDTAQIILLSGSPKGFLIFFILFLMLMFICQEFLRNPDRYIRLGARPPRGVLLVSFMQRLMMNVTSL